MSRRSRLFASAALALLLTPAAVWACLWDYDTLQQERSRFPSALELITGKFLRHSPEFYQWRIRDRTARLAREPDNLAFYDDLAVAYEKTGDHEQAMAAILKKEAKKPGLYETYANLGTFYIHSGQFEKGGEFIDKALAINPDAHFGREKYQKLLVQYVMSRRKDGKIPLPLAPAKKPENEPYIQPFAAFLARELPEAGFDFFTRLKPDEAQKAVKGILGMMRFGQFDSPVLLEALGNILTQAPGIDGNDAKRLATRAFLKASYEVKDEESRTAYRQLAAASLHMQTVHPNTTKELTLDELERGFRDELADAAAWYGQLREQEIAWIRDGKDPEAEFAKLYAEEPVAEGAPERGMFGVHHPWDVRLLFWGLIGGFVAIVCLAAVMIRRLVRRRNWPVAQDGRPVA